jgi:hypothetical protein
MSNIDLLKDKNINCFIIYFYFALFFYLLSLSISWLYASNYHVVKGYYELVWQFDEVLYAYLIWPFFSLLNLSYITFKNNKIKLYFSILLIVSLTLVSIYYILSLENIYKINFPEQFSSLYVNSVIFVIAIISTFILFTRILFKNNLNKHNCILLNSYFFLIILFIAMLFIVVNKPKTPIISEYFFLSIFSNLYFSFLLLFIPFLNFLFLILINFFGKYQIILFIVITILAFWDLLLYYFLTIIVNPLSAGAHLFGFIFIFLPLIIWAQLYLRERSYSLFQKVILFSIIMVLFYSILFMSSTAILDLYPPPPVTYKPGPVYELASSIIKIILFLIFVNMVIYLKGKLTLKVLK